MAALSIVAMAGCAGRDTQGSPPASASTHSGGPAAASALQSGRGVLYGQVLRPPGLDPRSGAYLPAGKPTSLPGPPVPVNGDEVEVQNEQGQTVAAAVTGPGDSTTGRPAGSFTISLPPGEYRIVEGICGISQRFSVASGSATHVTLMIKNAC